MNSTLVRPPYGTAQTTVCAASFAELVNGPDFPKVRWMTMVYHRDQHKLSVYGYEHGGIDHHLIVTGLGSEDEKRVVEILAALNIAPEEAIRRTLQTRRFCYSFVHPSIGV